jgi:intein/homing endonuclease
MSIKRKSVYAGVVENNGDIYPVPTQKLQKRLAPGVYTVHITMEGQFYFKEMSVNCDRIVELPSPEYQQVIYDLETFLKPTTKSSFESYGFIYKRSALLHGVPGCHAAGAEILMYDGTIKKVENIKVGDLLMGPDSKPRTVLQLAGGREEMVRITPTKGDSFVVNVNHILHLTPSGTNAAGLRHPVNIKFSDYVKDTECLQGRLKLTRTGVDFSNNKELPIDPYILGSWLGDGTSRSPQITSMDKEILDYWESYAKSINLDISIIATSGKAMTIGVTSGRKGVKGSNSLLNSLQELELLQNKHIPLLYKTTSREARLALLAGILDTDGSLDTSNNFDYISKSNELATDVVYLARSLGFAAYLSNSRKECVNNGVWGDYFRVCISGDLSVIPNKLPRKQAIPREQIKSVLRTGFTYEILPEDAYYGFSLSDDHLYLTSDFTIHHNTGKSVIVNRIIKSVVDGGGVVLFNPNPELMVQAFSVLEDVQVDALTLVVFEEFDDMVDDYESELLSLLDGEVQKSNVMYLATTNNKDEIPSRILRPGRFSCLIEVKPANLEARQAFLKHKGVSLEEATDWASKTEGFTIDELKEVVLSVKCLGYTLDSVLKRVQDYKKEKPVDETDVKSQANFRTPYSIFEPPTQRRR